MKNLFMLIIVVVILSSCDIALVVDYSMYDMPSYDVESDELKNLLKGVDYSNYTDYLIRGEVYRHYKLRNEDLLNIKLTTIESFVKAKISYSDEGYGQINWKTPKETWDDKKGDCEDISILIMYFAKKYLDVEMNLVKFVDPNNDLNGHISAEYNDILYYVTDDVIECTNAIFKNRYNYKEAIKTAEYIK